MLTVQSYKMTGLYKKKAHERKHKSGLSTLKKKLNIPKIYKRLASKLSVHGRHIRSLTSNWSSSDIQSLICQYEMTNTLKEISDAADLAQPSVRNIVEDLTHLRSCGCSCDLFISCDSQQSAPNVIPVHSLLFTPRTSINIPDRTPLDGSTSDEVALFPSNPTLIDQNNISYMYNTKTRTLRLVSDDSLPSNYIECWLSHIYGEKCMDLSRESTTISDLVLMTKQSTRLNIPEVNEDPAETPGLKNNRRKDIKSSLLGNNSLKLSNNETKVLFDDAFLYDMKQMWSSSNMTGDVRILFSLAAFPSRIISQQATFFAHSCVLAARSCFFKDIIVKYKKHKVPCLNTAPQVTLELDWRTFSPRYVRVLLHAMYTDEIDLQLVIREVPIHCSTKDPVHDSMPDEVRDLTEMFHLGRFIDFPMFVQGCEEILQQRLTATNVVEMLRWSSKPHASAWLHRQVIRYMRDNFVQLTSSGVLTSLSLQEMTEVIKSDFVSSPELDILRCVLKWSETELMRRFEREPNLVRSHVTGNLAYRNSRILSVAPSRRRDVVCANNSEELHECTAPLLSHVRLRHVLPPNHEVLTSAIKRGIISCPPDHLLDWLPHSGMVNNSDNTFFWLRDKSGLGFLPPRLFPPHWDEAKTILEERICNDNSGAGCSEQNRSKCLNKPTTIVPDALYMVGKVHHASSHVTSCEKCRQPFNNDGSISTKRLSYIDLSYPVPGPHLTAKLLDREYTLRHSEQMKRVLHACDATSTSLPHCRCGFDRNSAAVNDQSTTHQCNLCRADHYLRLLVVREHGLPDVVSDLLRRPYLYYDVSNLTSSNLSENGSFKAASTNTMTSSPRRLQKLFDRSKNVPRKSRAVPENLDLTGTWENRLPLTRDDPLTSSSSEQSLSDGSSVEWPFPYNGGHMRVKQPGSSFWDSDSSLNDPTYVRTVCVPDVAASADSTLNSHLSSSSSSSNSSQNSAHDEFSSTRRTSSYSHYLSLRRPRSGLTGHPPTNPTTQTLNNPIPQLVIDGTRTTHFPPDNPDIFASSDASRNQLTTNGSAEISHVPTSSDQSSESWSSSKETRL